ncbi:hypothetical protein ACLOJK_016848 [Asimina triloba]
MSAASSFLTPPADTRQNKWKKKKTDSNLKNPSKKQQQRLHEDDEEEEEEEDAAMEEEDDDNEENEDAPAAAQNLEAEILSDGSARICNFPSVVKHTVNRLHPYVLALASADRSVSDGGSSGTPPRNAFSLENISHGQIQALSVLPAGSPALAQLDNDRSDGPAPAYVCTPPPIVEGKGVVKRFGSQCQLVLPMHSDFLTVADWFSPTSVHRLERQAVPHFFSGKSIEHTPERYMQVRNRIVAKYMENPDKRLSVADIHGLNIGVNVHDLNRIVRFLDHWGIINYMAAAPPQHGTLGAILREEATGEVHIPADELRSIDSLIRFDKPKCRLKLEEVSRLPSSSLSFRDTDLDVRIRERLAESKCNHCSRALTHTYYQSQKVLECPKHYTFGTKRVNFHMECGKHYEGVLNHAGVDNKGNELLHVDKLLDTLKPSEQHVEKALQNQFVLVAVRAKSKPLTFIEFVVFVYTSPKDQPFVAQADGMLCVDCFHDGRFVAGNSSIDFVKVNSTKGFSYLDGDSWSDQETLLLLEALEVFGDNWNDIAEHVGTKSKAQCILQFIRLPMEDGLLEHLELPSSAVPSDNLKENECGKEYSNANGASGEACQEALDSESIPFAKSANPVMPLASACLQILCICMISLVKTERLQFLNMPFLGPRVAAACAHASLAALSKEDKNLIATNTIVQMELSTHGDRSNPESIHAEGAASASTGHQAEEATGTAFPLSPERVRAAAKFGLSAAATKAKMFADHEEREIQRSVAIIINHQLVLNISPVFPHQFAIGHYSEHCCAHPAICMLKRLELKLKQFAEVESLLMKECEQVERTRQRLSAERARVISTRFGSGASSSQPGAVGANSSSNTNIRQPVGMPAPATQAGISAYSSNQPTHPHMSFMPRQPMFSFGPRLPLSMIHPSSSSPSATVMFPSGPASAPVQTHPMLRPVSGSEVDALHVRGVDLGIDQESFCAGLEVARGEVLALQEQVAVLSSKESELLAKSETMWAKVARLRTKLEMSWAERLQVGGDDLSLGSIFASTCSLVIAEYLRSDVHRRREEFELCHHSQNGYVKALLNVALLFPGIDLSLLY